MSTQTEEELTLVKVHTTTDANSNPSFHKTRSETLTAIEYLVEFIDSRESLDIYQFLAIYGWKHRDFEDLFRAIVCLIAQVIGINLIREEMRDDINKSMWECSEHNLTFKGVRYKLLAFAMSMLISYRGFIILFKREGIYKITSKDQKCKPCAKCKCPVFPKNISKCWALTGFIIKKVIAVWCIVAGWQIISFSENAFGMVISSIAIFKLIDLDASIIGYGHYKKLKGYINQCGYNDEYVLITKPPKRDSARFIGYYLVLLGLD